MGAEAVGAERQGTSASAESVREPLERAARLYGTKTAVIDGDREVTYSELRRRVAGLGGGLRGLGVAPGDVVAVMSLNSLEHLECWLGIPAYGAILNDLNHRLAPAELAFVLDDCAARVLIVDDTFLEAGRELAERCESVQVLVHAGPGGAADGTVDYDDLVAAEPCEAAGRGDDVAGIFYTGGTTGLPKGVMLTHANLVANAKHCLIAFRYHDGERYLHAGPMFHLADGASTYAITWAGATHVIHPAFEPEGVARALAEQRITVTLIVPTMINMLVNHPAVDAHDLSALERVYYGGSPMPGDLQRQAAQKIGCEWIQVYGMTEAAPIVTACVIDVRRGLAGEEPHATRLRSAGSPVVGVEAEIRRDDGTRADPGEPGEIWVRGPNVMAGYWNRPEETAAALTQDGWYRSGDAAYCDEDGFLYIVDRVKDMIISGGENIYSVEVEHALFQHPDVLEATVFGVPDERWGECVHAVVVPHPGKESAEADLIAHCRDLIAGYKLPRSIDLSSEPLPKSGAGKVLKRDLRERFWAGQETQVLLTPRGR